MQEGDGAGDGHLSMTGIIFRHFDADADGFWRYEEAREAVRATEARDFDHDEYVEYCEAYAAAPGKGLPLQAVEALYESDPEALVRDVRTVMQREIVMHHRATTEPAHPAAAAAPTDPRVRHPSTASPSLDATEPLALPVHGSTYSTASAESDGFLTVLSCATSVAQPARTQDGDADSGELYRSDGEADTQADFFNPDSELPPRAAPVFAAPVTAHPVALASAGPTVCEVARSTDGVLASLQRLERLFAMGALTEEEYQASKAVLLGQRARDEAEGDGADAASTSSAAPALPQVATAESDSTLPDTADVHTAFGSTVGGGASTTLIAYSREITCPIAVPEQRPAALDCPPPPSDGASGCSDCRGLVTPTAADTPLRPALPPLQPATRDACTGPASDVASEAAAADEASAAVGAAMHSCLEMPTLRGLVDMGNATALPPSEPVARPPADGGPREPSTSPLPCHVSLPLPAKPASAASSEGGALMHTVFPLDDTAGRGAGDVPATPHTSCATSTHEGNREPGHTPQRLDGGGLGRASPASSWATGGWSPYVPVQQHAPAAPAPVPFDRRAAPGSLAGGHARPPYTVGSPRATPRTPNDTAVPAVQLPCIARPDPRGSSSLRRVPAAPAVRVVCARTATPSASTHPPRVPVGAEDRGDVAPAWWGRTPTPSLPPPEQIRSEYVPPPAVQTPSAPGWEVHAGAPSPAPTRAAHALPPQPPGARDVERGSTASPPVWDAGCGVGGEHVPSAGWDAAIFERSDAHGQAAEVPHAGALGCDVRESLLDASRALSNAAGELPCATPHPVPAPHSYHGGATLSPSTASPTVVVNIESPLREPMCRAEDVVRPLLTDLILRRAQRDQQQLRWTQHAQARHERYPPAHGAPAEQPPLPSATTPQGAPTQPPRSAPAVTDAADRCIAFRNRLICYYEKYKPQKLASVMPTVRNCWGKEGEVFEALVRSYGPEPVEDVLAEPLVEGWIEVETDAKELFYFHAATGVKRWQRPVRHDNHAAPAASVYSLRSTSATDPPFSNYSNGSV